MVCCLLVAWLDTSTLGSNSCISPNFTIFHLAWPCVRRSLAPVSRQWMATRWQIATKRWELRLSRMPSRTELHRSAVTDRPKWESELLVWPVQNDVFWCIFYLLNVFQCILVSILSMSCMCWRVPLLNPLWDVVGHFDSFASCSARKPLALATGKKKRRQPRLGRQLPMVSDSSYLNPLSSSIFLSEENAGKWLLSKLSS
jgi:hypothetical protein